MKRLLVFVLFAAGCASRGSGDRASESPEKMIVSVFEAGKSGRCEDVLGYFTKAQQQRLLGDREACPTFLKYLEGHPVEKVKGVAEDGREPRWKIVRVALKNAEVPRSFTVEMEDGRWKLASL